MKKFLESLIERKKSEVAKLIERSNASESLEEVRSISAQIDQLNEEVREAEAQLKATEERAFKPLNTYSATEVEADDMAYRNAFKNLVMRNVPIPAELRANTTTTGVASIIPTHLVEQIHSRIETSGMILSRVTRTSFKAGAVIPTADIRPVATWVGEGATSDKQALTTSSVTFKYCKLRCEVSISLEVAEMSLDAFEKLFVERVANAMVVAIEKAILKGTGTGQPSGLVESGDAGQYKTWAGSTPTYAELVDAESSIKVEHETDSVWLMTKAVFGKFMSMVDDQGQPIARVNFGISGKPERTILGREVIVHPYATEMGSHSAIIVNLKDYVLNTIYDLGISQKPDWDTEDIRTKAVMSVDGKMIDTSSVLGFTLTA